MGDETGPTFAKKLERKIWIRIWLANLVGVIPANLYFTLGAKYYEDRYEYTVIGDAANEASRLTDEAKRRPGRLLVSEETIRAAEIDDRNWLSCGELRLKGRPLPTTVYEPA